jgi:upstream activation factor subunit UAF30
VLPSTNRDSDRRGDRVLHSRHRRHSRRRRSRDRHTQEGPQGSRGGNRQGPERAEGRCPPRAFPPATQCILTSLPITQDAIKELIEARFDAISGQVQQVPTPTSGAAAEDETNGRASSADDTGADGEIEVSLPPPGKKQKRDSSSEETTEEADARLAAELQAQEIRLSRGRVTRGGASGAAKPKPKQKAKPAKKKSAKRARSDDESNADDSDAEPKKRKAGGGFQKPFNLSFPLAELCGESQVRVVRSVARAETDPAQLSRPQVVKKIWAYIKSNELQDPNDKRQILCDEKLHAVFKQDKVNMFSMNKLLGNQLYPVEE